MCPPRTSPMQSTHRSSPAHTSHRSNAAGPPQTPEQSCVQCVLAQPYGSSGQWGSIELLPQTTPAQSTQLELLPPQTPQTSLVALPPGVPKQSNTNTTGSVAVTSCPDSSVTSVATSTALGGAVSSDIAIVNSMTSESPSAVCKERRASAQPDDSGVMPRIFVSSPPVRD